MTSKELMQLLRDTTLIVFTIYAFTFEIYWAGSGVSLSLNNAALMVHDGDASYASRERASRLPEPYFQIVGSLNRSSQTIENMDNGEAMVTLDIPAGVEQSLLRGEQRTVQMR